MPVLLVGAIAFVLGCFVSALTRDAVGEAERTLALGPAPDDDFDERVKREHELLRWNRSRHPGPNPTRPRSRRM